jgi:thiol-disulfide isomerase/thioredoxin
MSVLKQNLLILLILMIVLGVAGFFTWQILQKHLAETKEDNILSSQNEGDLTTLSGEKINLEDYRGRVRLVNSWASWSPFSARELFDLEKIAAEYKDMGMVVLAINRKEDPLLAQKYLDTLGTFQNVIFILDPDDTLYQEVGGYAMPESIIYDRDGNIYLHQRGDMTYENLKEAVEGAFSAN